MYFSSEEVAGLWQACDRGEASEPVLIKRPFSKPMSEAGPLLKTLQIWASAVRQGKTPAPDIEYIDRRVLPEDGDETLDGCIQRIEEAWPTDWFAYINDMHQYDGELWERALEILMPAVRRHGGLPAGGFRIEGFFGKYGSTPTGIHLDSSDNFSFIARGPKRLVFWKHDRFQPLVRKPDPRAPAQEMALTRDYHPHLDDAIVIDAETDDVVYWPKEYWHVGSSPEGWTGMINLAMWWNASPLTLARFVLERVVDLDGEPRLHPFDPDAILSGAATLPPTLRDAVQRAVAQVAARAEPVARLVWASVATSYGFTTPPAKLPVPPIAGDTRLRVRHPLVPLAAEHGSLVVSCGHWMPADVPNLQAGCARLNASVGAELPAAEIAALFSGPGGNGHVGDGRASESATTAAAAAATAGEPRTQFIRSLIACRALELISA